VRDSTPIFQILIAGFMHPNLLTSKLSCWLANQRLSGSKLNGLNELNKLKMPESSVI